MKKTLLRVALAIGLGMGLFTVDASADPVLEGDDYTWQLDNGFWAVTLDFGSRGVTEGFEGRGWTVGVYDPYGTELVALFDATDDWRALGLLTSAHMASFSTDYFGFYITDGTEYLYSETDLNDYDAFYADTVQSDRIWRDRTLLGWDLNTDGSVDTVFGMLGVSPAPEPATVVLLGAGAAGLAGFARRRKKQNRIDG